MKPERWADPANKPFPYQVGFTCPPHDFDAAPSGFLRISPDTVGVQGRMLHVPEYAHELDQRRQNFDLLEEFVECMSNNGADVCGQVGSNWVHASGLGVDGIRQHCERLSETYETPFHMAGYAMVDALRELNIDEGCPECRLSLASMLAGYSRISEGGRTKDFPHYIKHLWTDEFLSRFNHSFLIRDPAKTITSMYKHWPDFDPK